MHESKRQHYQAPGLKSFANAQEVWDFYKDKGTPEERSRLMQTLQLMPTGHETEQGLVRGRA